MVTFRRSPRRPPAQLCAETTGGTTTCARAGSEHIPPSVVGNTVRALVIDVVNPVLCSILPAFAGDYGAAVINSQGDVYVDGEPQWDCPPYDIWPVYGSSGALATLHTGSTGTAT